MARSPALREALTVAAAAAAGWGLLVAVLFHLVPVPEARARGVRTVAAHRPVPAHAWHGAAQVYDELDRRAVALAPEERARVARAILEEAAEAGIAPLLVLAVIHVESRFDPRAVSPVGAVGLMQLMVPTFREVHDGSPHLDPFEPVANVRAGVRYLGRLVGAFANVELALVAYNAGPGSLRRHLAAGGVPDRLRGYPRDVLRQAVRLWPGAPEVVPVPARSGLRRALAAAHGPAAPEPLRPLARGGPRLAVPPPTGAALDVGAAYAAGEALALARPAGEAVPGAAPPILLGRRGGACIAVQVGLPMSRGRERMGPRAARNVVLG